MQCRITVETFPELPAFKMVWDTIVNEADVQSAFELIQVQLSEAITPHYIIMDLTANPQFPLRETIAAALFGPYRHPMIVEWIAVGKSDQWEFVEQMLAKATNHRNIRWVMDMNEAIEYVRQQMAYKN